MPYTGINQVNATVTTLLPDNSIYRQMMLDLSKISVSSVNTLFMRAMTNGREHVAGSADYAYISLPVNMKLVAGESIYLSFTCAVAVTINSIQFGAYLLG